MVVFEVTRNPAALAALMPSNGFAEHAVALDADIVRLLETVEVHVEEQTRGGLEFREPLADEHAVGAEVDVLLAREDFARQPPDFGIDHRLAAADGNDRRSAIVHRRQALLDRQNFVDRRLILANAAAARAGEIAGVQRLEHHHEREFLLAAEALAREIARHVGGQAKRNSHPLPPMSVSILYFFSGNLHADKLPPSLAHVVVACQRV